GRRNHRDAIQIPVSPGEGHAMTKPVPRFEIKNSCPHCHEPLRLVTVRTTAALAGRRHLLVCSSPSCTFSSAVDAKNLTEGLRRVVSDDRYA
ncbi:MAG TPA: hypothetical protein VHD95_14595, partial [Rhizomicrobium sp.]|nr:hypothetical protein [Rhizomicrobium sp.]